MDIYLYSFNKRNNSTKIPSGGVKVSGQIKEPSSLITPSISFGGVEPEYNYAHIPRFGRYYWIREWTFAGGLWMASMEVDVLASWKSYIGSSTQFVVRSSAAYDGDVIDSMYPATNTASTAQTTAENPFNPGLPTYVVGIIGKGGLNGGAVSYYAMNEAEFRGLGNYLLGDVSWVGSDFGEFTADFIKQDFNPFQYVVSVNAVPYNCRSGLTSSVLFGWWDLGFSAGLAKTVDYIEFSLSVPKHPQRGRGTYLNGPPYSSYTLQVPPFGSIPLDGNVLSGANSIKCGIRCDIAANRLQLEVYAGSYLLHIASADFGAPLQIAQVGTSKAEMIGGAASIAASIFTGDVAGAISGGVDALKSLFPQSQTKGANGSLAPYWLAPTLSAKFMEVTSEDNSNIGRPYYKPAKLSSLPGFIMTREADIAAPATAEEITKIENELNGGIFYE